MEIIDNINNLLGENLNRTITPGAKLKIAASYSSSYAFEALTESLDPAERVNRRESQTNCLAANGWRRLSRMTSEHSIKSLNPDGELRLQQLLQMHSSSGKGTAN